MQRPKHHVWYWFLLPSICTVALILVGCGSGWLLASVRVVIVNESGQTVRALKLHVYGETIELGDLPPGATVSTRFAPPDSDDYYYIDGRLDNGVEVQSDVGFYITSGSFGWTDHLVIPPDGAVHYKR